MPTSIREKCSITSNCHEEALEAYKEAVHCNPKNADAQYKKGRLLSKFGNHGEAVEALEKAIQLNPKHVDAYCSMGIALAGLGPERKEEAKAAFGKAIELNPEGGFHYSLQKWSYTS